MTNLLNEDKVISEQGATLPHIINEHKDNCLEENQFSSAKEYMQKVMYHVPLYKLYKVVASCLYEEGALFCPVLVKIIN